ncbi:hypothetical protein EVAR_41487_1 [Eumeta japonica]|uniref:Uncharacterized protein n=1 Tax=Eumeta variegata TaxID=151549 RepID=A0A4C1WZP3_EUMVA|nr:hypothetical protein EVAR_41487_1 [Eumeta japonica]
MRRQSGHERSSFVFTPAYCGVCTPSLRPASAPRMRSHKTSSDPIRGDKRSSVDGQRLLSVIGVRSNSDLISVMLH